MPLSTLQKKSAQAIVNVFETGVAVGDYGKVTLLPGDSGHLTYGRTQTTLASGNLFLLIKAYCGAKSARFHRDLEGFLSRLENIDLTLDNDVTLCDLLRRAGDDPVMHEVQDAFFDRVYWAPAIKSSRSLGIETALGTSVVYDSTVHGSWDRTRDRTSDAHGTVAEVGEKKWITAYVGFRRNWLANHKRPILRKTVYRMDAFRDLLDEKRWNLKLPFSVRGVRIDRDVLERPQVIRVSAEDGRIRLLRLRRPLMRGDDVLALQKALGEAGIKVAVDGVFGKTTELAIKRLQKREGLVVDGIVGPSTRAQLGL